MSRSYKKHPCSIIAATKENKKYANRKLRRALKRNHDLDFQNCSYKKFYESWDILDWISYAPTFEHFYEETMNEWKSRNAKPYLYDFPHSPPTKKECRNMYNKWYKRK